MTKRLTERHTAIIIGLALFVLALVPRALDPGAFVTWDEPSWTHRSMRFLSALKRGDWAGTFQTGHPGVTTMWADSVALVLRSDLDWQALVRVAEHNAVGDPDSYRVLAQALFATKISIALLTAAGIPGIFWLARRLWGNEIAFLGAALVALDPYHLALSRQLHLDALMTTFMTLSVLALLGMPQSQLPSAKSQPPVLGFGTWQLVLSAMAAGLAFLTKSTALFLLSFVGVFLIVDTWRAAKDLHARMRRLVVHGLAWGGVAAATYIVVWPAMWADPLGTLGQVFQKAFTYAETPHENGIFFLGAPRGDPGPFFYPANLVFHLTPLAMFAGLVGLASLVWSWGCGATPRSRQAMLWLLVYAGQLLFLLSFGAKKGERYLLPIFPVLDLLAAVGIVGLAEQIQYKIRQPVWLLSTVYWLLPVAAIMFQAATSLPYHPYYLAYFNPLVGGARAAVGLVPIGLGEGMELSGRYLDQQPEAREVAAWIVPALAPYYRGQIQSVANYNPATADFLVVYVSQRQRQIFDKVTARYQDQSPEATFRIHGIDYAWVYRNQTYEAPLAYLRAQVNAATDVIVFDEPSLISRHYSGSVPTIVLQYTVDETRLAEELRNAVAGRQRVWYVTYPDGQGDPQQLVSYQLATHAYQESVQEFPEVRVVSYRLPPVPEFQVARLERQPGVEFGGQLSLRAIGLDRPVAEWARGLGVTAEWNAESSLDADYTVFLHLVDRQGRLWGQVDQPLRDSQGEPTSKWMPGQPVTAHYSLPLLPGTPPGRYELKLGVYEYPSGQRLGLQIAGAVQGTEYELGNIDVVPSPLLPPAEIFDIPYRTSDELPGQLRLLGADRLPESVRPGQSLPLTLFWQATGQISQPFAARLQLREQARTPVGEITLPLASAYPTDHWRIGEVIRGRYDLPVNSEAAGGEATIFVLLLDPAGSTVAEWPLGQVRIEAISRRFDIPPIQHPQHANFGDGVTLLGYDLSVAGCRSKVESSPNLRPETCNLQLTLYWQARATMTTDYTVFVHVLGPDGRIWGQVDHAPGDGQRPTTGWLPDEVIVDRYTVPIAYDVPPGTYRIEVGLYEAASGQRLPAQAASGSLLPDNRVLLDQEVPVG